MSDETMTGGQETETPQQTALAARPDKTPVHLAETGMVQLTTLDEGIRFARWAVESGLLPNTIKSPAAAFIVFQKGAELGFKPLTAAEYIYPVGGRPRLSPAGALALVRSSGLLVWIDEKVEGEGDDMRAIVTIQRKGDPKPKVTVFSVQDAKTARLWGKTGETGKPSGWVTYPKRMLLARARGFALQDTFPDLLGGLPVRDQHDLDPGEVIGEAVVPPPNTSTVLPPEPDPLLADVTDAEPVE